MEGLVNCHRMPISRRTFGASAAALSLGLWASSRLEAAQSRHKLLILLVAEQFRSDYLARLERYFSPGGFRRLMSDGAFFPDCRCLASTFTRSSLATVATGAYPEVHGIVADYWYDRTAQAAVAAGAPLLGAATLAEQFGAERSSRVFAFGSEEAHAGLLAGRAPAQVFSTNSRGQFVARGEQPAWIAEYNRLHPIENVRDAKWVALGAGAGVPPLRTLTYDAARPDDFHALYRASPFAQAAQFEFLREWIAREKMGQGDTLDFLAVSLGSMAMLGYDVGADSPLMEQMVLHLDRELDFTLDVLNKLVGADRYLLAFTAAHGAVRAPDAACRARFAVDGETVARAIGQALSERLDTAYSRRPHVEKYVYPFVYLRADSPVRNSRDVRAAAGRAALALPQVAGFYTADGDCSHHGDWQRRFRNSFHATRSGDLMLSYQPDCIEDSGSGRGISYGSLYNYDARVPLLLYGPGFRAGTHDRTVELADVAPTLARAVGVAPPSSSTGAVLSRAFTTRNDEEP